MLSAQTANRSHISSIVKKLGYISKKTAILVLSIISTISAIITFAFHLSDLLTLVLHLLCILFFSDLLTVVGVPAIDPVLKRAQFNQKINSLTQVLATINNHHLGPHGDHHVQDDSKKYKRNVSSETRRYAAIRLAASTSSLSQVGFVRRPLAQQDPSELELNHHDWYLSSADFIFITSSLPPFIIIITIIIMISGLSKIMWVVKITIFSSYSWLWL